MASSVQYIIEAIDKYTPTIKKIMGANDQANKQVQKSVKKTGNTLNGFSKKLSRVFAVGTVLEFGRQAVTTFADFESGMSNVKALTQATGTQFDQMRAQAIKLGSETAFTAKQSSEAMAFLAQAGFSTQEIMEALPATLNLAAAGSIELGAAADIASNIMKGFNIRADKTTEVTDIMARLASKANTNITEMGEAFKEIAPTAAALNQSVSDTGTVIGLLANAGFKGTRATNSMNTALTRLAKPTAQMQKAMDTLGLQFFDSEGKFIGFRELIKQTNKSLVGYSDEAKAAAISTLFGANANAQFTALLNTTIDTVKDGTKVTLKGADAYDHLSRQLTDKTITAASMASIKLDNLKGDFTKLTSAIEGQFIKSLEGSDGSMRRFTQGLTTVVQNIQIFTDSFKPLFNTFKNFFSSVEGLLIAMGLISEEGLSITDVMSGIGKAVEFVLTPIRLLIDGFTWVNKLLSKLGSVTDSEVKRQEQLANSIEGVGKKTKQTSKTIAKSFGDLQGGAFEFGVTPIQSNLFGSQATPTTTTGTVTKPPTTDLSRSQGLLSSISGGKTTGSGSGVGQSVGISRVEAAAPKNITINLGSLIDKSIINSNSTSEAMPKIRQQLIETLVGVLNDTQIALNI